MKRFFKIGLAVIIPFGLVVLLLTWLYNTFDNLMLKVLPTQLGHEWWYVFLFVIALFIAIMFIGLVFSFIKPLHWIKRKFDQLINNVPVVNKIYSFGLEISDALIEDGKFDGAISVVLVNYGGMDTYGLLTNHKEHNVFIATAPNPMNGFVFVTEDYKLTDYTVEQYLKWLTSLGKLPIGG